MHEGTTLFGIGYHRLAGNGFNGYQSKQKSEISATVMKKIKHGWLLNISNFNKREQNIPDQPRFGALSV